MRKMNYSSDLFTIFRDNCDYFPKLFAGETVRRVRVPRHYISHLCYKINRCFTTTECSDVLGCTLMIHLSSRQSLEFSDVLCIWTL